MIQHDLTSKPKLLIVSDTPLWKVDGAIHIFEPTLREVEFFSHLFSQITWIGFLHEGMAPNHARPDRTGKINFVLLPRASGGKSVLKKAVILPHIPGIIGQIVKHLKNAQVVHTRGPSVPALIAILLSVVFRSKTYWHKFAGNWGQKNAPASYAIQRFLLKKSKRDVVTVNGVWPDTPHHILVFENPCFTEQELQEAKNHALTKNYEGSLTLLFAGRMEYEKGAFKIIDALTLVDDKKTLAEVIFAGHGKDYEAIVRYSEKLKMKIHFAGLTSRESLNLFYKKSHLFLLPTSASEGFPKVIAEAAAFGCVPVVSDISSISNYVKNGTNGYVLKKNTPEELSSVIRSAISDRKKLREVAERAVLIPDKFTYERYNKRIAEEIIFNRM